MGKKAQVAMESLMIYGVAILIVMLAIGGLIYFGVLDMGSMLPDKCTVTGADFNCEAAVIGKTATSGLRFELKNNLGKNVQPLYIARCEETEANDKGALLMSGTTLCGTAGCALGTTYFVKGTTTTQQISSTGASLLNGELARVTTSLYANTNVKTGGKVKVTCMGTYRVVGSGLDRNFNINAIVTVSENV
jgi:hypothetical protein